MTKIEKEVLHEIRQIKVRIEESRMPLDTQYECIESMQRILNLLQINN